MEPVSTFRRGGRTEMEVSGDRKALRRTCKRQLRLRRQGVRREQVISTPQACRRARGSTLHPEARLQFHLPSLLRHAEQVDCDAWSLASIAALKMVPCVGPLLSSQPHLTLCSVAASVLQPHWPFCMSLVYHVLSHPRAFAYAVPMPGDTLPSPLLSN